MVKLAPALSPLPFKPMIRPYPKSWFGLIPLIETISFILAASPIEGEKRIKAKMMSNKNLKRPYMINYPP